MEVDQLHTITDDFVTVITLSQRARGSMFCGTSSLSPWERAGVRVFVAIFNEDTFEQ